MKVSIYKVMLNDDRTPMLERETIGEKIIFDNAKMVYELAYMMQCDLLSEEYSYLLCLDMENVAIGLFELSHGTNNKVFLNPREVFQKALLIGAAKIIIWHNHTSGNSEPSNDDIQATKDVVKIGEVLRLPLIDHIIIGYDEYFSFSKEGMI